MAQEYVVYLENRIRFNTVAPVSVDDVVASLRGMEKLVTTRFPKAIRQLTGATVKRAELTVASVEEGSLVEETVVSLVFGSKKHFDKFIGSIRAKFVSKNDKGETVVKGWVAGALLVGIAVTGIGWYQSNATPAAPVGGLVTVNGDNNVIVTIGAEAYEKSPDKFAEAIEKSMTNQQKIAAAKAGVEMLTPARTQGVGLELMSAEGEVEVVSPETARKVPATIEKRDQSEDKLYERVKLHFRASDSDSDSRGWAGTIPQIVDNRTRVIFADSRDVAKVSYKPSAEVDATVTYSDALHTRPVLILVEKVY